MAPAGEAADPHGAFNTEAWAHGDYVADYSGITIAVPEAVLVARHREALRGTVIELGCGAGRLTRVLAALCDELRAFDVSPAMAAACRRNVPTAHVEVLDIRDLSAIPSASTGAIVATDNLLDIFGDAWRRATLAELHRILRPGGLLLFSTHNRAHLPQIAGHTRLLGNAGAGPLPVRLARRVWRTRHVRRRWTNRRRTRPLEGDEAEYAMVNDGVHEHRLVMYYIGRDAQERQLDAAGLTVAGCLDGEGRDVLLGGEAPASSSLYYAAYRAD